MNVQYGYSNTPDVRRPWQIGRDYDPATARLLSETEDWLPVLRQLNMSPADLRRIFFEAQSNGSTFLAAFLGAGVFSQLEMTNAMAAATGLGFSASLAEGQILGSDERCAAELARSNPVIAAAIPGSGHALSMVLGPHDVSPGELAEHSTLASQPVLVPLQVLRRAIAGHISERLTSAATQGLFDWRPDLSARYRMSPHQAFGAGASMVLFGLLLWFVPTALFICIHLFSTVFFFACSGLKAAAAWSFLRRKPARPGRPTDTTGLPVYSVLVALHREADVVPQLLTALDKLVWPRDRLEIKLVCEADDRETIDAIDAVAPPSYFETIEVPPSLPRTKPKALRYALALTSGEFVVLYDAEDRPHPDQLLEAYATFMAAEPEVVCLQAPLQVTNGSSSLLARMFAFEYAGLFRSVLPWLAAHRQVLPLGGTSNHFRGLMYQEHQRLRCFP